MRRHELLSRFSDADELFSALARLSISDDLQAPNSLLLGSSSLQDLRSQ